MKKMKKKNKLVHGIGINDFEGSIEINGKSIKSYTVWTSMLQRCYSKKYQEKRPTYIGCSVSDDWLSFSNFKTFYDDNYNTELGIRLELDKDLLVKGNKVYSKETCVFLPSRVNSFLTNKQSNNTSGCTGVSFHKETNKWRVDIKSNGKRKWLGRFTDINLASECYQHARAMEVIKIKQLLLDLFYPQYVIDKVQ